MVPWINRHTDTSIRVNEKGNFESKQTDITIFKETVYVSYMYDIVIRHNEDTKLVDTSHHERDAYSWILARNGVTSTKDYAHAIYIESKKCKCGQQEIRISD